MPEDLRDRLNRAAVIRDGSAEGVAIAAMDLGMDVIEQELRDEQKGKVWEKEKGVRVRDLGEEGEI